MSTSWPQARAAAHAAVPPLPGRTVPLTAAGGAALVADAVALSDLPAADTSAMDGWAVRGPAPWRVVGEVLAGGPAVAVAPGEAVRIATGAVVPAGDGVGVLRREWGACAAGVLGLAADAPDRAADVVARARDVRPAGLECRAGDVVVAGGTVLTPAALGMLAAAGHDAVAVRRARAEVLVLGDELLHAGPARDGRLRDALGPLLAAWLPRRGAEVLAVRHVPDTDDALAQAVSGSVADVLVTTGSTARGPVDHLHAVLDAAGARWVVDGVAVRPGHPQLLALLPDGRPVVGLPGNPLAAVSGVLTLVEPVLAALHGLPLPRAGRTVLDVGLDAGDEATRLVPVRDGRPVLFTGPAMLRGLALADAVAVVPPGGLPAGSAAATLALPGD